MSTVAAVASIVAGITGILALRIAVRETQRRRFVEIVDLVTDIKAAIDWGSDVALRRDELQGRLRTRLGRMNLPKTRELASTTLRSETRYSQLADSALIEARDALEGRGVGRLRRAK